MPTVATTMAATVIMDGIVDNKLAWSFRCRSKSPDFQTLWILKQHKRCISGSVHKRRL